MIYFAASHSERLGTGMTACLRRSLLLGAGPAVAALLVPLPAVAQMLPGSGSGMPSGSPLDQRSSRSNDDDDDSRRVSQQNAGDAAPDYRIDPVTISGSDRPLIRAVTSEPNARTKAPPAPNEFQRFVELHTGDTLQRFGTQLLLPDNRDYTVPSTATVPPEYVLNIGDVVTISLTGSVEGSVDKEIDTNGRIFLPNVGPIQVAGTRYGDLKSVVSAAVGTKYRGYNVNVGIRALRGVKVYVTGFANNPGAYTVNSLSTLVNAVLAAGGPSAGGSFRSVQLVRNNEVIRDFDLYTLILNGQKGNDAVLQNEDVINIGPLGQEMAVAGSVNNPAIFEIKPGESLEDVLRFAGGPNSLGDTKRLLLYRVENADDVGVQELPRGQAVSTPAQGGDIVQVLSEGSLIRSIAKQSVVVRIEGEVARPGNYYLPSGSAMSQVIEQAGGLSPRAFVYGTRFERQSVRRQQRESFNEALRQMELSIAAAPLTAAGLGESVDRAGQAAAAQVVIDKLRQTEPDGRVVLDLTQTAVALPGDLVLENNDRIVVPPRPTTVGVFGAVYRPASFQLDPTRPLTVKHYLERAGGALRSGDRGQLFVVHLNGEVISKRDGALSATVIPGDVVFVPVKTSSSNFWSKLKDLSQIAFQLGLSTAAFIAVAK